MISLDSSGLSNNQDQTRSFSEASMLFDGRIFNSNKRVNLVHFESCFEIRSRDNHTVLRSILASSCGDRLFWSSFVGSLGSTTWWSEVSSEGLAADFLSCCPWSSSVGLVFTIIGSWWAVLWILSWIIRHNTAALIFWCNFLGKNQTWPETTLFAGGGVDWGWHFFYKFVFDN